MDSRTKALKDSKGGVLVYTTYVGDYVTRIYAAGSKDIYGDIYGCEGTSLDMEGKKLILALKCRGYEITYDASYSIL